MHKIKLVIPLGSGGPEEGAENAQTCARCDLPQPGDRCARVWRNRLSSVSSRGPQEEDVGGWASACSLEGVLLLDKWMALVEQSFAA